MDHISSANEPEAGRKSSDPPSKKTEHFDCPRCGALRLRELIELPKPLQEKAGKKAQYYEHPCSPACEQSADLEEWEATRRRALMDTLMERSGVSKRLRKCTLENFRVGDNKQAYRALEKVEGWLEAWPINRDTGRGMVLSGDVGTGKTHLAVATMRELQDSYEVPCLMMSVPELLDDMRQEFDDDNSRRGTMKGQANMAELLVLDDLGSEKPTPWSVERLFIIIDHRYREQLPTIYTTNLGYEEVKEVFGRRISSRLLESSDWVFMEGRDFRRSELVGETDG